MASIAEGSSRQGRRNSNGTFRINCSDCGEYISDSVVQLGKVRCELCLRALNGQPLPLDAIQMYNAGKLGMRSVSALRVEDDLNLGGEKFTFRSLLGLVAHAVGFDKPAAGKLESVKVSRGKRRERLFADVDLEAEKMQAEGIGSMEDIDGMLKARKDK